MTAGDDRSNGVTVQADEMALVQPLLGLASARACGLGVLDGGFATHLEDVLRMDLSQSPLWSASLLMDEKGCKAIKQTHKDFLDAGAQIILTSTYQASFPTLESAGYPRDEAQNLLVRSVQLAAEAREEWIRDVRMTGDDDRTEKPLIALSLGPYGAALSNGAEYTGSYLEPHSQQPTSLQDLKDFHYDRLAAIASCTSAWDAVDLLAFETLPRIDEARAIRLSLRRLYEGMPLLTRKPTLASFVFPTLSPATDAQMVPFDPSGLLSARHESFLADTLKQVVETTLACDDACSGPAFDALGVNCTKPDIVTQLIKPLSRVISTQAKSKRPLLFIYPDGGLVWDGLARTWNKPLTTTDSESTQDDGSWADGVLRAAVSALGESKDQGPWAACFVGGCCKSTAADIRRLRDHVDKR